VSPRKFVLVDGSSYLYRAFHALPPLTNSRGEPTGAVLGVLNMLQKLVKDEVPDRIAVVFDAPGRTFRDDLFEEYKANRPPMPDDLRAQVQPLLDAVEAMGLPLLRIPGVEADDVIGTLAARGARSGYQVLISTGDKDMAQLVGPGIELVNTMSNTRLDRIGVKAKFDVFPEQIIDYLALVGDSSDNIPGVSGVGPKTAAKWLNQYHKLDELIANAASIPGKVGENLRAELQVLELSRKLATIDTDVTLEVTPDELLARPADVSRLRELYTRLELRLLLRSLDPTGAAPQVPAPRPPAAIAAAAAGTAPDAPAAPAGVAGAGADPIARHYDKVTDQVALDVWLARLAAAPLVSFDTETDSLNYMQARIVGVSFSVEPGSAAYVPLAHDYPGAPPQLGRDQVLAQLKPLLEDPRVGKLGHHLKYDCHVLANHGIALSGQRYDTMLESYVLNSVASRHDMDSVAERHLGIRTIHFEDVAGKGAKQLTFNQVDVDKATEYSAEDADITLRLHRALWPQIEALPRLRSLYETIEQPLVPVLFAMERTGVFVDRELLKVQSGELRLRMAELEQQAHAAAGGPFNLDSPKQLQRDPVRQARHSGDAQDADRRAVDRGGRARGDGRRVSAAAPDPRIPRRGQTQIDLHGQASGADRSCDGAHPHLLSPGGGGHRPAFLDRSEPAEHSGAHTRGPAHTAGLRRAPGCRLIAADYSQIELRIMAHLSGDASLLAAFAEDRDIHQATAAEVFGTPQSDVTADQRRSAKAINFGLIYGMSAFGLARQLGIGRGDAQKYVDLYFERYPGVKRYMDETRARAREDGYVETVFGRRLYLPEIQSRNAAQRQYAERSAINAPMQGTAADIIKRAMIDVHAWLQGANLRTRLIMQVHDELVLEAGADEVAAVTARLRAIMVQSGELRVPLKVDVGVGDNWDEAH
jgi:DNA polymerase I